MKPFFEKVLVDQGSSWTVFHRRLESFPFEWHYHSEFELTMTLNSLGQRYIGDHIGSYGHEDLILLGPNLPHTWCSAERIDPHRPASRQIRTAAIPTAPNSTDPART